MFRNRQEGTIRKSRAHAGISTLARSAACCAAIATVTCPAFAGVAVVCTNIIEDFESYTVADGEYLDPTTVLNSDWSRSDLGNGPDYEVTCCSPGIAIQDDTFDGSAKHLRLRRANNTSISTTVLNSDFALTPMSDGTVSFEINPSSTGGAAFRGGLYDSVTGFFKVQVVFKELTANSGDFEIHGPSIGVLANSMSPDGFPDSFDRWFRVAITTHSNGTFDVIIDDIGETSALQGGHASDPNPRGNILTFIGDDLNGGSNSISNVDSFRLGQGAGNGGNNDFQPTMIDNIAQCVVVGSEAVPVVGTEVQPAKKITYGTDTGTTYQAQFTDDLLLNSWNNLGAEVIGDGATNCVFESLQGKTNRAFRVIAVAPPAPLPVVEDFEYSSVNQFDFVGVANLSTNWTRSGTNEFDWAVTCCIGDTGGNEEDPFDGSDRLLALNRSNPNPPVQSDENTDFDLGAALGGPLTNHTVSVEMNPSRRGSGNSNTGAFNMSLVDSTTGLTAVRIIFWEITNNSGDFEVFDAAGANIGTGMALNNFPAAFGRWFRISVTIQSASGTMDVLIDDIGPTSSSPSSGDAARGNILAILGSPLSLTGVDTFRLLPGAGNGGGSDPTLVDNIAAGTVVNTSGIPTGPIDCVDAKEISFPTVAGKQYQPQYNDDDDNNWTDLGGQINGSGGTDIVFDVCVDGRQWQVLDLQP